VGNDNLGNREWYLSQPLFTITQNANQPAILFTSLGNAALQWETSESYDVALEFTLFNNFLEGSFEYYKRNSTELLFSVPIAPSNGLNELVDNVANMYNSGFEIGLTGHLLRKGDLQWDMTVLATTLKNEITSLPSPFIDGSKRWTEGRSRFDFFLYETAGVDPQTGDQLYYQYDTDGVPVLDGDGNHLTTDDWSTTQRGYVEASAVPDLIGSVSNTLRYKGFDFNFLITYGIGGEVLDNGYSGMMHSGAYGASWHPDILNAWRQPGDITDVPRLQNGNQTLVQTQSSRFITDASFMAMRNVSLGYNLNSALLSRLGLSSLRVSLTGENLFLKSKRVGLNPQFNLAGTGSGNDFVPGRIFSLGLNLSF
jgi:outer membrane receptor protein involved in Fe transport